MDFQYNWKNKEANFGPPVPEQIAGGTHITLEIILKKDDKCIALRRPKGIPEHQLPSHAEKYPLGLLYFCHNLIRYGESIEECVKRIVKEQADVAVKNYRVIDIDSMIQAKDNQWSFMSYIVAEVESIPAIHELVAEVILFDQESIPNDFAWWSKDELQEFLESVSR